jgi:hypothetical protein
MVKFIPSLSKAGAVKLMKGRSSKFYSRLMKGTSSKVYSRLMEKLLGTDGKQVCPINNRLFPVDQ